MVITDPDERLLSVSEAAEILQLGVALVRRYCETGRIRANKIGHNWTIYPSALENFKGFERRRGRPSKSILSAESPLPEQDPETQSFSFTETDAKAMLGLISAGLIDIRNANSRSKLNSFEGRTFASPHPKALILGWSYLSAACLHSDIVTTQPIGVDELYAWCCKPLNDWPLPKTLNEKLDSESVLLDLRLIDGEQKGITFWCEEWARSRIDLRSEFDEERIMPKIRVACQEHGSGQLLYERVRQFLIEHPVVSERKFFDFCNELPTAIMDLLAGADGAYLSAPESLARGGHFYVCPYCGSILIRADGVSQSSSEDCEQVRCQNRRKRVAGLVPETERTYRLVNGIRRYVTEPGWAEVELKKGLEKLGLQVQLWPYLDSYDLRIILPNKQVWGIDVKDWSNPIALGLSIRNRNGSTFAQEPSWDRAFFVFPDDLKRRRPNYVAEFKGECYGKLRTERGQRIEGMFMREFLAEVRKQVRKKQ